MMFKRLWCRLFGHKEIEGNHIYGYGKYPKVSYALYKTCKCKRCNKVLRIDLVNE